MGGARVCGRAPVHAAKGLESARGFATVARTGTDDMGRESIVIPRFQCDSVTLTAMDRMGRHEMPRHRMTQ